MTNACQAQGQFDWRLVTGSAFAILVANCLIPPQLKETITAATATAYQAASQGQNPISAIANTGNNFNKALAFSLKWEGGYSNEVGDVGGRTWRGVTEAEARRYGYNDPRQISEEKIRAIYRSDYWDKAGCGRWQSIRSATVCLDTAINYGAGFSSLSYFQSCPANDEKQWALCIVNQRKAQRHRQAGRTSQAKFLAGWLNRDADLEKFISH